MARNLALAFGALASLAALAAAAQSAPSISSPQAPANPQAAAPLQVKTRLVTVDVVATDSHGNPVRGLTAGDFEVVDHGQQKIERFSFVDKTVEQAGSKGAGVPVPGRDGFYTNQAAIGAMKMPPTVILMDSLNTDVRDVVQTRRHMLELLKTLPSDTPVAVFLLQRTLHVVQGFTSDPALLRAAVDAALRPGGPIVAAPEDDLSSMSLAAFEANQNQENDRTQTLEDFEKETYANLMDIRVSATLDALKSIARYLSGFPGRKNLIWVSDSFPIALLPDTDFGTRYGAFQGVRSYASDAQDASDILADAQVAVYPVDARGLETNQSMSASARLNPRAMATQISRENEARALAQISMQGLADDTGGKTCKNTNDLSGCVQTALHESLAYYELTYEPQGVAWDGSFHKISLKVRRSGVRISYRRGYYAEDAHDVVTRRTPDKLLQDACNDYLPATALSVSARSVSPRRPGEQGFLVSIPANALTIQTDGESHRLNAEMAACVFNAKGTSFQLRFTDLSQSYGGPAYAAFQAEGLSGYTGVPDMGVSRVRFAVLDLENGRTGALDVLIRPAKSPMAASPAEPPIAGTASTGALDAAPAGSSVPDEPRSSPDSSISFDSPAGESGTLDWGGAALIYRGDLGLAETVPAFFSTIYAKDFECRSGSLARRDGDAGSPPSLRLTFSRQDGQSAVVDLKGDQPEYSGTLPVDLSARPFFERLWYLAHCRSAP